ncbi:hypothetical protein Tcur_2564 [Thermomonospora curvata DSM 43183]|uniref:Uncharacterized protein n=1 Tax=Thermomonospora curvata (strain ATCC 19995 / DSM 43183 / JCM 3096 / KCTC 9072 / NBRC 15933 / NCIMB 10081 / Henssen B9) TaxID=471852 RepID=D1A4V5_THECD|nr:hypothetical protein Tcur_2564 [Thermomonospora curvata DSM 43183]
MHESGDLLDIALWGTLRFDAAGRCLYLGAQDKKILPAWSRVLDPGIKPVLRNGKRGIGTGGHGVIMEGDVLIAGGSGAERRDSSRRACRSRALRRRRGWALSAR